MDLFLESYSLDELSSMPLEELADYLRTKGKNRFPDPEYVAKSIQKAVRSSYRLDKIVEDSIDTILATSITLIHTFEKQIKELDKSVKRIMKGVPQTLQTVSRIGQFLTVASLLKLDRLNASKMKQKLLSMQVYIGENINLVALRQMIQLYRETETSISDII